MTQPQGIMFHHFHGAGHAPGQGSICADTLRALIRYVGPQRILPAREWLRRANEGALDIDDLCLTFDDNLRCQNDVALPVLREFDLTGFWFVTTATMQGELNRLEIYRRFRDTHFHGIDDFYEAFFRLLATLPVSEKVFPTLANFHPSRYLSEFEFYTESDRRFRFVRDEILSRREYEQVLDALIASRGVDLSELARGLWMDRDCIRGLHERGHVIGLHSHTHPTRIAHLTPEAQFREYRDNFMSLLEVTHASPTAVSHPCNSYSRDTLTILRRLGITVGFRANPAQAEFSELEYPRQDHSNLLREMQACGSLYSPVTNPVTSV